MLLYLGIPVNHSDQKGQYLECAPQETRSALLKTYGHGNGVVFYNKVN